MNYLRITNNGLICAEDLMLIGSSTKRDQVGKIGMFGSGWKYALAWLMRNGCKPIIMSGTTLLDVDFTVKMHRDKAVEVITVNGEATSLTTEMGPKWTGWMALREIISNAIDEGGHEIQTAWNPMPFRGEEGITTIYIPMNSELAEVMLQFDRYFAFNRKETFKNPFGRLFLKKESSPMNIYRRGIRCFDTKKESLIDFDFEDIAINEDRLAQSYSINYKVHDMLRAGVPSFVFKAILLEEKSDWIDTYMDDTILNSCKELIEQGETFTTQSLQKLGGMLFGDPNALIIPASWYKKLQDLGLVKSIFESLGGNEDFIRTDSRNVSGIKYYLSGAGFNLELRSGKCESDAFYNNGVGYVKDDSTIDDKQLAATIIKKMPIDHIALQLK